jgi:uncharacterized membrane protein YqaE (UPF0057 family)
LRTSSELTDEDAAWVDAGRNIEWHLTILLVLTESAWFLPNRRLHELQHSRSVHGSDDGLDSNDSFGAAVRTGGGPMDIVRCFIAFFVPPLAVYLQEGLSRRHWITVLLTILGIFPGILFAVYVVFEHESRPHPLRSAR